MGQDYQLLGCAGWVFGIDGLVDAGDGDGGVTGVLARSVDGVPVPGTVGQAGFRDESGLGLAESEIQLGEIAGGRELAVMGFFGNGAEAGSGGQGGDKVERAE